MKQCQDWNWWFRAKTCPFYPPYPAACPSSLRPHNKALADLPVRCKVAKSNPKFDSTCPLCPNNWPTAAAPCAIRIIFDTLFIHPKHRFFAHGPDKLVCMMVHPAVFKKTQRDIFKWYEEKASEILFSFVKRGLWSSRRVSDVCACLGIQVGLDIS